MKDLVETFAIYERHWRAGRLHGAFSPPRARVHRPAWTYGDPSPKSRAGWFPNDMDDPARAAEINAEVAMNARRRLGPAERAQRKAMWNTIDVLLFLDYVGLLPTPEKGPRGIRRASDIAQEWGVTAGKVAQATVRLRVAFGGPRAAYSYLSWDTRYGQAV